MIDKGIIIMEEELQEKYRPRKETFVLLTDTYEQDEDALKKVFDRLEQRAPKQLTLLITWIRLSRFGFGITQSVARSELLRQAGASAAQLDPLVKKGVFRLEERKIIRQGTENGIHDEGAIRFTAAQEAALEEIRSAFDSREVVLLHGVTSSGKTEMYIRLIGETLSKGKQVLYLLPEIALTAQIINRLKKYFGNRVGVYHSRFSDQKRVEIWNTRFDIILGARSAVFLPFRELGLIIVDEEHDSSYKQMDPAPRYNGRDAAMVLARIHQAKTLLGSATPSVESYYNAKQGKYALVELTERYGNMELPKIRVVNIRDELRKGTMRSHFSSPLMQQLSAALEHREQSILFQNRRGFSLRLECDTCQWMPACKNCDVTLVYHKKWNQLRCHYCGYVSRVPETCPQCHGTYLKMKGFGTEKVEEELGLMLPDARILRMDLDTTRSRHAHRRIIEDFEAGKIDIMVGTQMVTKGLDFDRVSTVCILNADNMLGFPDFRSEERSFQLMAQVSGRSGRRYRQGEVIIQTYNPYHPVIRDVVNHDYMSMYLRQIADRKKYRYPPLYRLVQIRIKHRELNKMIHAADALAVKLRQQFGNRVLGPEFPLVARIMNYHIKHIMIKFERSVKLTEQKQILSRILTGFASDKNYPGIRLIIDVDPS
jgi:primosomal protein N' (replication factor Y)